MKATSIFGGVQVFQIIIGLVRSKFIAILLGPTGMGIAGLLQATVIMVESLTNFGLSTSAVKDISAAHSTGNQTKLAIIVTVFKRWVWITGTLGFVVSLILSPLLSRIAFGHYGYTWSFIVLSITLLINQIATGYNVILRGTRQISSLAKSSLWSSVIGLCTTIPLYYMYGMQGIVPAMIVTAIVALILAWYFANKVTIQPIYVAKARTIAHGKGMISLGFMISLSGLITLAVAYIVRLYISHEGGVDEVGLYNAGFAIITVYVGMVFSAMSTDYFPRLAAVAHDNTLSKDIINQQAEIALLILAPIIMIFLVFINWIVLLLYSTQFLPVSDMILYAAMGMFFKAASWSIAFIFLAKGANTLFFWNELGTNIYLLIFNIIGYKYYGLTGLGVSFLFSYICYLIQVFYIARVKYNFSFTTSFIKIFSIQFGLAIISFITVNNLVSPYSYLIGSVFILVSGYYTIKELVFKLNIRSLIFKKIL